MTVPAHEHEQKETISIDIFVPDHPPRTESPIFRQARDQLIKNNPDAKCWIDNGECDHDHPLELHHAIVEWCDAEGVDWELMKKLYPDFPDWDKFDPAHPEVFIDSAYNARLVLCKKHHTGKNHGIHYLPFPVFLMQKHKRADFVLTPDEIQHQPV